MPTHCRGVYIFTSSILFTDDISHHYQGKKAAQPKVQKAGHTNPTSPTDRPVTPPPSLHNSKDIQGLSTTLFEPLMDHPTKGSHRVRTAKSGNPHITVVHNSGIFDMEILYCICTNAVEKDEQLMNAGLFPSSFKQIDTAFTFTVLDDLLMDNLECKTTAQQYYFKFQSITNRMFPDSVPVSWNSLTTLSFIL